MSVAWLKEIMAIDGEAVEELDVVFETEWEQDGKYQFKRTVVKLTDAAEFDPEQWPVEATMEPGYYLIHDSRSGSYYSDWEYNDPDISKVEPYEVTVTKWRKVS